MNGFVYNQQRDAYKAFKGFYYQVELTVIRWLELQQDTILVCECGEDIDLVKQIPDTDPATQLRLLEQVKIRDRITLRSSEALIALARFHEAVFNNPALRILYRLSTTAIPGQERGILFPRNLTGIGAWTAIREDNLNPDEAEQVVTAFKTLLAQARCPEGVQDPVFVQLQEYVASAEPQVLIDEFMRRFEWATGLPSPPQLRSKILAILLRQLRAHLLEEAQLLADVLTVHVFRFLTQRGEKRLTGEDLERLLLDRSITELDHRLLTRIVTFVQEAEVYLPRLSSQLESVSRGVTLLQAVPEQLSQLTQQVSGIQSQFLPIQFPPPDELPIPPVIFAPRRQLVSAMLTRLSGATWLNVTGATGMGKTLGARLLAEAHGLAKTVWISLRGEQASEVVLPRLELHLLRLASTSTNLDLVDAYISGTLPFSELAKHAALSLGANGLLIIDEVPDLLSIPQLRDGLMILTTTLQESGGKLLTTAQRNIPSSMQERLDTAIAESPIPSMAQDDIDEMLSAAGAPSAFHQRGILDIIHTATRGHPTLISATISFLRRNAWTLGPDQVFSILAGDPVGEVRAETRQRILRLLPDDNTRELLYRLSLIGTPFSVSLARAVAAAPPAIPRSAELLPELTGPWVHQLTGERFEVSPLLSDAGQVILDLAVRQRVHRAIAVHHLGRTIDQNQALQIILHLFAAQGWDLLTAFLVQLAPQIREKSHAQEFEVVSIFLTTLWPETMPLLLRILVRAVQVRVLILLGKDAEVFINDLDTMILHADMSTLPMALLAHLLIGPMNPAAPPVMAARRTLQACRLRPSLPAEMQELAPGAPLETLLWAGQRPIRTRDDIRGILCVLADMTEEERRAAFIYEPMSDAPLVFADRCWTLEIEKPMDERDWHGVLSLLSEIRDIAQLPGGEPLQVPVARAKAIVLADNMERPKEALAVLEEALSNADRKGRSLLNYTAGCILLDHSTPQAALESYNMALAEPLAAIPIFHFDALRRAAEAAARMRQWPVARDLSIRLLKLFKDLDLVYDRLEMIGELALSYWALGSWVKAWGAMSGLLRGLLRRQEAGGARFREVVRKAGHVLGWMAAMTQSGTPPTHTFEGQPYSEPFPGFFSRSRPQLAEIPFPPLPILLNQLGMFAAGCGLFELAWRNISQGRQLAQSQGLHFLRHSMDWELAELAARKEDFNEGLRLTISGIRVLPAAQQLRELRVDTLTAQTSVEEIWDGLPREQRRDVERMLYWTTIGPAITGLLAKVAPAEAYATAIAGLMTIFQQFEHDLIDPHHWSHMLGELSIAFGPMATRESIGQQIRSLPETESHLRLLLYLALSRAPNATLTECCGHQAMTFEALLRCRPSSRLMAEHVATYLLGFWTQVAETQAFALRNPKAFRSGIRAIQRPTVSNVATLLLLAEDAIGIRFGGDLRTSLVEATKITLSS